MLFIYSEIEDLSASNYVAIITEDGEILWDFAGVQPCLRHLDEIKAKIGRRLPEARLAIFEFLFRPKDPPSGRLGRVKFRKRLLP